MKGMMDKYPLGIDWKSAEAIAVSHKVQIVSDVSIFFILHHGHLYLRVDNSWIRQFIATLDAGIIEARCLRPDFRGS